MFFIFISSYTEEVPQSTECCVMVFELTPKLFVSQALALYWNCKCVEMEEKFVMFFQHLEMKVDMAHSHDDAECLSVWVDNEFVYDSVCKPHWAYMELLQKDCMCASTHFS